MAPILCVISVFQYGKEHQVSNRWILLNLEKSRPWFIDKAYTLTCGIVTLYSTIKYDARFVIQSLAINCRIKRHRHNEASCGTVIRMLSLLSRYRHHIEAHYCSAFIRSRGLRLSGPLVCFNMVACKWHEV